MLKFICALFEGFGLELLLEVVVFDSIVFDRLLSSTLAPFSQIYHTITLAYF